MSKMSKLDELFEQARAAFDTRDWTTAIQRLEQIIEWYSAYPGAEELLKQALKRQGAEPKYQQGVQLLESKNWKEATKIFKVVLDDDPDHPSVQVKLQEAERWAEIERLEDEANKHWQNSNWDQAIKTLTDLLRLQDSKLNFDWGAVKQQLAKAQAEAKLASIYKIGKEHFERKEWRDALQNFEKLRTPGENYRDVDILIEKVQQQIKLERLYLQAKGYDQAHKWADALELYEQIYEKNRSYEDVAQRMAYCNKQLQLAKSGKGSVQKIWVLPLWILSGFFLTVAAVFILRRQLHCLLEYRLNDVFGSLIVAATGAVVAAIIQLVPSDKRKALWCGYAGAAIAILICLLLAILFPPSQEVCAEIGIAKLTPVSTPPMTSITAIATSAPSNTPMSELTKTLTTVLTPSSTPADTSVSTDTPSPTSTDTPTDTPTVTDTSPTPTDTPTTTCTPSQTLPPRPTATFTPSPTPTYPPPTLIGAERLGCNVTFKWSWSGNLAADEWFAVRVGIGEPDSVKWVQECEFIHSLVDGGEYCWEIAICKGKPEDAKCSKEVGNELAVSGRRFFSFPGCRPVRP